MKDSSLLQLMFAFFLGLVLVAFVGVAVNTAYPQPEHTGGAWENSYAQWALITCIILLVCATAILAVSLFLPDDQAVISNGILMGGVFTMIYAVGTTFSADTSWARLVVITVALAVTVGIGYLKFVRGGASAPAAAEREDVSELGSRVADLERKIDAIGKALRG